MTQHNDEHSSYPPNSGPMVGVPMPGDALVPGSVAQPLVPQNGYAGPGYRSPEVVSGGMDRSWFFHSLRRRWLLALGMGLVLGGGAAGLLWYMFPESSSAVALFRVYSTEQTLAFHDVSNDTNQFEILQNTQLALLKSNFVLRDAVRDPSISNLPALANEEDPIQWLSERLSVVFPQESEILKIAISGDEDPEDLREIVDAVAKAYKDQVLFAERRTKLSTKDVLQKVLSQLNEEIRRKMEDYKDLAKELGTTDGGGGQGESKLLISDITAQMNRLFGLQAQLMSLKTNYDINKRRLKDSDYMAAQYAQSSQGDPTIAGLSQQIMSLDYQIQDLQMRQRRPSVAIKRLQKQRETLQQQLSQYSQQVAAQGTQAAAPDYMIKQLDEEFRIQAGALTRTMQQITQRIEAGREQLAAMGEKSVELAVRDAELTQLKEIAKSMAIKIESREVELQAPPRITQIQAAQISPGINKMQRYMISAAGGAAAFALTCFAIAYIEFRNRRLNGPTVMDEGLGIRVVGTLPSLSSRRALDPSHPIVAQLTESIDGVRTLLMHDSTSKQRQVVLVTSAMTLEGRTTVASQLAASLARAGRRTLLLDGDLRRPALHALFDVPLEDGLCEVLRGDAELGNVIRPTHAENLWLMTAGYCDVDAVQALAREERLESLFKELRSDYDFIIIDAAPVLGLSDSLLFGQFCDGALLSVLRDHSEVPKIYQAAETLRGVGIRLLGSVVNGVSTKSDHRVTQLRLNAPRSERQELQTT